MYQFNKKTGSLSLHPLAQKHPRLNNMLISVLYRDSKERIWIGTEESLFVYADGKLEEWKDETSRFPALVQAFCIHEDSNHHIWICTSLTILLPDRSPVIPPTTDYPTILSMAFWKTDGDGFGSLPITDYPALTRRNKLSSIIASRTDSATTSSIHTERARPKTVLFIWEV